MDENTPKLDHTRTVLQWLLQAGMWYCSVYTAMAIHITLKQRREVMEFSSTALSRLRTAHHPRASLCSSD